MCVRLSKRSIMAQEAFYLHVHSFSTLSAKQTHSGAQNQFGMRSFANRADYALCTCVHLRVHVACAVKCVLLIEQRHRAKSCCPQSTSTVQLLKMTTWKGRACIYQMNTRSVLYMQLVNYCTKEWRKIGTCQRD